MILPTESPIEDLMASGLAATTWRPLEFVANVSLEQIIHRVMRAEFERTIVVAPQVKVGPYRLDFLLCCYESAMRTSLLCIECDGENFHKANHAQVERDRERDRYLQGRLIKVIRFSGKTLTRDPYKCGLKAFEALTGEQRPERGPALLGSSIERALGGFGKVETVPLGAMSYRMREPAE